MLMENFRLFQAYVSRYYSKTDKKAEIIELSSVCKIFLLKDLSNSLVICDHGKTKRNNRLTFSISFA